jgi:hypothetical protein
MRRALRCVKLDGYVKLDGIVMLQALRRVRGNRPGIWPGNCFGKIGVHWRRLAGVTCLLLLSLAGAPEAQAQDPQVATAREWAPVAAIPDYYSDTLPPVLVADSNRTVHAFATLPLSDDPDELMTSERAIFYRQWTLEDGWSEPVDIMLTPVKLQARVKGAFLDDAGILHMVFYGGDEQESYIYYTWAPASQAASAASWSRPLPLGNNAGSGLIGSIIGDGADNLVVAYSGDLGEGNSLYVIYSDDAGVTWSEPELLFSTYRRDSQPADFNWSISESGTVHMVWNVTDRLGGNVTAFYAQLQDIPGRVWSKPMAIDTSRGLGLAAMSVIEYQGKVMLIYNNGREEQVAPVMWFRMSTDGGKTFDNPVQPFPNQVGRNGPVSFVVDSSGTLYGFFGQRVPGGFDGTIDLHGMWQTVWQGNNWGPVTPVVSGPFSPSFDPGDANAVISQGNVILLTWRTDPGRDITGTWYTHRTLNTPELPVVPLPEPILAVPSIRNTSVAAAQTAAATSTAAFAQPATPAPLESAAAQPGEFAWDRTTVQAPSPAAPLVSSLAVSAVFVVVLLLVGSLRRQR